MKIRKNQTRAIEYRPKSEMREAKDDIVNILAIVTLLMGLFLAIKHF